MGLGLSTYIQYGCLYGSKSMNMLITMAPKCGTPHPCGHVVNSDGLLKWHSFFCLFNHSFIHFTILQFEKTECCKQIVWLFQIADNFSWLCNCILLHICLSIQVFLEFLNGVSCVFICVTWYFIFAWNYVSYLCNMNVLYLCDITFYILPAVNSVRVVDKDRVPGIILLGRSGVKTGMTKFLVR